MALITAQDYILLALRKLGQIRPGALTGPELLQEFLNDWQLFFDNLSAERYASWSIPDYVYPVTGPGSKSNGNGYQIGPTSPDWVGPRPESIVRANLVYLQATQPVYIQLTPLSAEEWAALSIRQIPAIGITNVFYYDPQFPNGVFNVFPPLNSNSIEIFEWGALAAPSALNASYSAPPAYGDMVVWNLAKRNYYSTNLQVVKQKMPYGQISGHAAAALAKIRRVNRNIPMISSEGRTGMYGDDVPLFDSNVTNTGEPY